MKPISRSFNTPGEYRLVVPGMGGFAAVPASMTASRWTSPAPTRWACIINVAAPIRAMPYTRFKHDICHAAPASVPGLRRGIPVHLDHHRQLRQQLEPR